MLVANENRGLGGVATVVTSGFFTSGCSHVTIPLSIRTWNVLGRQREFEFFSLLYQTVL